MDHGKAAAVSLAVCGALLLVGCKHPPVELGHDVKVVCIDGDADEDLHLEEGKTTFQFGRSLVPNRFRLKELQNVEFPWDHARYLKRLECDKSYTWSDLQNSDFKCFPATARKDRAASKKSDPKKSETETLSDELLPPPCKSTCTDNPHRRVQGYVKLHPEDDDDSSAMMRHCVQLYDIDAGDGKKAGVLMMLYHPEGSAHAGYAHGEEQ